MDNLKIIFAILNFIFAIGCLVFGFLQVHIKLNGQDFEESKEAQSVQRFLFMAAIIPLISGILLLL